MLEFNSWLSTINARCRGTQQKMKPHSFSKGKATSVASKINRSQTDLSEKQKKTKEQHKFGLDSWFRPKNIVLDHFHSMGSL